MVYELRDFKGYVGRQIEGFDGVHGGNRRELARVNAEVRILLELCDE